MLSSYVRTLVISLFFLSGCSTQLLPLGPGSAVTLNPTPNIDRFLRRQEREIRNLSQLKPDEEAQAEDAIQRDFSDMFTFCKGVLTGFETRSNYYRQIALGLAIVGAIAGSVIVPGLSAAAPKANAAWTAAFGGVSGVTNTAQHTMTSEGLSGSVVLTDRNTVVTKVQAALEEYFGASGDITKSRLAIQKAKAACAFYALTPAVATDSGSNQKP